MATTAPVTDRAHKAAKRYIYAWGEGSAEGDGDMRDLLGGKGAGLAEMTKAGLPDPPGFTITTDACNDYFEAASSSRTGSGTTSSRRSRRSSGGPARASATPRTRSSSASAPAPSSRCPG